MAILHAFILFMVLAQITAQPDRILAEITFYGIGLPENTQVRFTKAAVPDTILDEDFLRLLADPRLLIACTVGIWRFYPNTYYDYTFYTGLQIGTNEKGVTCYDISTGRDALNQMRSYRALGRIEGNSVNLNQRSVTLYSKEYGSGSSLSLVPVVDIPANNLTARINTKSFVMTGIHDRVPTLPEDALAPIFKIFWDPGANPVQRSLCVRLVRLDGDGIRTKLYFNPTMEYQDVGGATQRIVMGALDYRALPQSHIFCPDQPWDVRSSAEVITIFKEVKFLKP